MQPLPANPSNPRKVTLIIGAGGYGKTSLVIRALINLAWTCEFIFDLNGQFAQRLKSPWVGTAAECDAALYHRRVCFNPYRMFKANETDKAFDWFAGWAFDRSKYGHGKKILVADDSWAFMPRSFLSEPLANVIKLGRFWELEFCGITHKPMEYHNSVRGLVTEWVAFNSLPHELTEVEEYWPGVVAATTLPKYEFVAYNRDSRVERRYKLPL